MCGIAGFFSPNHSIDPAGLEGATRQLSHRGPDGMQLWMAPNQISGLGHTRLAIIDLALGQQPMSSSDGRHTIVFNGEIYNFRELRRELEARGHGFRTRSDTEVLLNGWREWGPDCVARLNGMFAFAIFDETNGRLILARDRTGIKPLYYHHGPGGLLFASELKSLLTWPQVPRRVNYSAIADFLMLGYPLLPATCFRDCHELEPGTLAEVTAGGLRKSRYWQWTRKEAPWNETQSLEILERELSEAVEEHLVADVPVGAFLSGGIDSSLLASLLARRGHRHVHTFNVKFGEPVYDESRYARMVARHVGSEHHELPLDSVCGDPESLEEILDQFDQPFGDSSAIPTYLICREIRRHVKVVIGGDGGDEMFGGYPRFAHADAARLLGEAPRWCLRTSERLLSHAGAFPANPRRQLRRLLAAAEARGNERLVEICAILSAQEFSRVATPDFIHQIGAYHPSLPGVNGSRAAGGRELMDATIGSALPSDYLRKVDIASSAHGLEVRVPMLANRVLDFSAQLPKRFAYSWRQNKILLRKLAARHLPREVVEKRKQGFGIPLDTWLGPRGRAWLCAVLSNPSSRLREFMLPGYVQTLLSRFQGQRWDKSEWSRYSLYQRVYALWSLERWLRKWQPTA